MRLRQPHSDFPGPGERGTNCSACELHAGLSATALSGHIILTPAMPETPMPESRLVLIEGLPATGKTRLTQELGLQLEARSFPHQTWLSTTVGNPLARPFEADAYADFPAYAEALVWQWQNFAIRAAADGEAWLFDNALLGSQLARAMEAGITSDAIATLVDRLLTAVEPLAPVLIYLSRPPQPNASNAAWMECCEQAFAGLQHPRVLLNAGLSSAESLLEDSLQELALPPVEVEFTESVLMQLAGAYGAASADQAHSGQGGTRLQIEHSVDGERLRARLLETSLDPDWRALLPSPQGHLVVAGIDLRLHPQQTAGTLQGLLPDSGTPTVLEALPAFLLRQPDPATG